MSKSRNLSHLLQINLALLFISTSGVLGRSISLAPTVTTWGRAVVGMLLIGAYCLLRKDSLKISSKKDWGKIILSGLLFGGHWLAFFYALHLSNVAIAVIAVFTYPMMTVLLEPLILKTSIRKEQIFLAILVLIGVVFLAPSFELKNKYTLGMLFGMLSGLVFALRNIISKSLIEKYSGSVIMFYQTLVVSLFFFPLLFASTSDVGAYDWWRVLALGLVTTAMGHTLYLQNFKHFTASTMAIFSGIQPFYAIMLAVLFLGEIPDLKTMIGGLLVIGTVVVQSRLSLSVKKE